MEIRSNLLLWVIVLAVIASVGFSYKHFVLDKNYLLEYEVACDPSIESCFSYACEEGDAECEPYDYKLMVKYAHDVYAACGEDVTTCESAQICNEGEEVCDITYCDPEHATEDMPCSIPPAEGMLEEEIIEDAHEPADDAQPI